MAQPGTFREADGSAFAFREAIPLWSAAALEALRDVAHHYNGVLTYAELGQQVQARTGISTRSLLMNWIGQVLEDVAIECRRRGELLLTSLCVHQDGMVGAGYAGAVGRHGGGIPSDPELHAAEERLRCYRKYAVDLPQDGGAARLTPQEQARRRAAAPPRVERVCPVHHTTLPRSGQCDDCA